MKDIFSIEQMGEKYWQIDGRAGKWQYYGYPKEETIRLYYDEIEARKQVRKKVKDK